MGREGMTRTPAEPTCAVQAAPRRARFSLAANYDPELVPAIAAFPVDEVYGKFPAQAVSISPEYRTGVLRKYAEMDDSMVTGRLWGV
jgi:hypothetical protein